MVQAVVRQDLNARCKLQILPIELVYHQSAPAVACVIQPGVPTKPNLSAIDRQGRGMCMGPDEK